MAHTVSVYAREIEGVNAVAYADLTFSSTYATNGETLTPGLFGLTTIESVIADVTSATTAVITATFNRTTGKLVLKVPAGTEVANGASLTNVTASVRVVGN